MRIPFLRARGSAVVLATAFLGCSTSLDFGVLSSGCAEGTFTCAGECVSREVYQAQCAGSGSGPSGAAGTGSGGDASAGAPSEAPREPCKVVHRFAFRAEDVIESVHLSGSMNDWTEPGAALTKGEDDIYTIELALRPGEYVYKFVIDGARWITDPSNPRTIKDGYGSLNSAISVFPNEDAEFEGDCDIACFDSGPFEWRDAVMYSVFIDRFADADGVGSEPSSDGSADNPRFGWGGGDIAGLRSKLAYISDLGASMIWLGPPQKAGDYGYHGYWPLRENSDYSDPRSPNPQPEIEPRFGSGEELKSFITEAHAAGVKVLLDYVAKHVHEASPLAAAHPDWFFLQAGKPVPCSGTAGDLWDDPYWGTRCTFSDFLWPFDYESSPAAIDWSLADMRYWAEHYGFDAFRIDAAKHLPAVWIERLRQEMDEIRVTGDLKPYLMGETFSYDHEVVGEVVDPATRLDGQLDFPVRRYLCAAMLSEESPMSTLAYEVALNSTRYAEGALMASWLGNHDIPRQIHYATGEVGQCTTGSTGGNNAPFAFDQPSDPSAYLRLQLAFAALLTTPGLPVIYAGDEIGLAGGGDPENRRMMVWSDEVLSSSQKALRAAVRKLARLRQAEPALRRGPQRTFSADIDTWVFERLGCGSASSFVIAINRASSPVELAVPNGDYVEIAAGSALDWQGGDQVKLAPRSFVVLRRN